MIWYTMCQSPKVAQNFHQHGYMLDFVVTIISADDRLSLGARASAVHWQPYSGPGPLFTKREEVLPSYLEAAREAICWDAIYMNSLVLTDVSHQMWISGYQMWISGYQIDVGHSVVIKYTRCWFGIQEYSSNKKRSKLSITFPLWVESTWGPMVFIPKWTAMRIELSCLDRHHATPINKPWYFVWCVSGHEIYFSYYEILIDLRWRQIAE